MDYEKKYKDILSLAKSYKGNNLKEFLDLVFPELNESEDERIRKEILECIETLIKQPGASPRLSDWIAWLEKQKENIEKEYVFRPLPGTNTTIAAEQAIERAKKGEHLVLAFNGMYIPVTKYNNVKELVDEYYTRLEKQKEQKPNLLPGFEGLSPDEEMSHPLFLKGFDVGRKVGHIEAKQKPLSTEETELNSVAFLEQLGYTCIPPSEQKPAEWKQENNKELTDFENAMMHIGCSFFGKNAGLDPNDTIAIKEQANLLLTLIQTPVKWSEEDERNFYWISTTIQERNLTPEYTKQVHKILSWLKSFRPHWKPSEEQMKHLAAAIEESNNNPVLESLYHALQKLL